MTSVASLFPLIAQAQYTKPKGVPILKEEGTGLLYWKHLIVVSGRPHVQKMYLKPEKIYIDFENEIVPGFAVDDPDAPTVPLPGPKIESQEGLDAATNKAKAADPDLAVDPDATLESYQFGQAGGSAAAQAFGYGIAASLAGLGDAAQRIAALRQEIVDLEAAILQRQQVQQAQGEAVAEALADRDAALQQALNDLKPLPLIGAADPLLAAADSGGLFATPDPFVAARLHRSVNAIIGAAPSAMPADLRDTGLAAVRQADIESAVGSDEMSASLITIARTVADVGIGLDPITGTARSVYELVTGVNLVTNVPLSDVERGLAAINVMMLGGFGTVQKGAAGIAKLGRVLGGARGRAIIKTITEVATHWPVKMINQVLEWNKTGLAVIGTERIGIQTNRALRVIPKGAVDGRYARVMPREYAEALAKGGLLTKAEFHAAFITEAKAIDAITSRSEIVQKLTLLTENGEFVKLTDHVVVEFRFVGDGPWHNLASPFGEAGKLGPGFLPGGQSIGGAPEWMLDNKAVSRGLIDISSLHLRELPNP